MRLSWHGARWRTANILDQFEETDRGGGCMAALLPALTDRKASPGAAPAPALALPLLLAGGAEARAAAAAQARAALREPRSLRQALTLLAAETVERGCSDAL